MSTEWASKAHILSHVSRTHSRTNCWKGLCVHFGGCCIYLKKNHTQKKCCKKTRYADYVCVCVRVWSASSFHNPTKYKLKGVGGSTHGRCSCKAVDTKRHHVRYHCRPVKTRAHRHLVGSRGPRYHVLFRHGCRSVLSSW